jgi:competence protein ComEC
MSKFKRFLAIFLLLSFLGVPHLFAADLQVHFIDVGQGDSVFIVAPSGKKILIDAGIHPGEKDKWNPFNYIRGLKQDGKIDNLQIDYAILTHPDRDHYVGFRYLCGKHRDNYDFYIAHFYYSIYEPKENDTYWKCLQSLKTNHMDLGQISARGPPIDIGEDIEFTILFPFENLTSLSKVKNDDSIVSRLKYKQVSFLFTGDAPTKVEKMLLDKNLESTVLKVGHHGSKYSSHKDFLEKLKPNTGDFYAVISSNHHDGLGRKYGHPHKEALERLEVLGGVNLYRTDLHGTIVFKTDGLTINVEPQKKDVPEEELWKPGRVLTDQPKR